MAVSANCDFFIPYHLFMRIHTLFIQGVNLYIYFSRNIISSLGLNILYYRGNTKKNASYKLKEATSVDFKHENNKFSAVENSEELAYLSYAENGDVLTVDHTEVSPKLEGQGIGKKLVSQVVEFARS